MSDSEEVIGIVGTGSFGLALAFLLGNAGRQTLLWSPDEAAIKEINKDRKGSCMPDLELSEEVQATSDPDDFAKRTRFLVVASSSGDVRNHMSLLGNSLTGNHMAVHDVGAFCSPDDQRVSQVIAQETAVLRTGVLAGPSMASFIAAGRGTSLLCASEFDEVTSESRRLLSVPPKLRLYRGRDLIGAELAAALSMSYTISIGLADAIKVGIGIRAVLITRAVAEMARLGAGLGAQTKTFWGLAGLGNLLVRTAVEGDAVAPSYRMGMELGAGAKADSAAEPYRATLAAVRLARQCSLHLPVLETTARVLQGELDANQAATELLAVVTEEE
jgi:glycerol-3-phosphate dehydrogenase (NAD(P)+)